jgi:plastocyanin
MKRMSIFELCVFSLLITLINANAGNDAEQKKTSGAVSAIKGSFGVKLGERFDTLTAIGRANLKDGIPFYKFSPLNPYEKCDSYYVYITPTTKIIYSIVAQGEMKNDAACKHEQKVLMELLTKKYGSIKGTSSLNTLHDVERITQGDREIYTNCTGSDNATLRIVYTDHKLDKQAEEESTALEVAEEKTDDMKISNKIVVVKTLEEPYPATLFASLGTTVIWVNHSRFSVEVIFIGKQVVLACGSPVNFFVGKDGSYESHKIPSGGTASLCFLEKGRYTYKTKPSKRFILGKKGEEHYGTVWIK